MNLPQRTVASACIVLFLALSAPTAQALEASTGSSGVTGTPSVAAKFPHVTGAGVTIAVIDTGVDDEHETFRGAYVTGVDLSRPPDGTLVPAVAATPCENPDDVDGHGTHVAGIALGRGTTADGARRGIAPGASLFDVKVAVDFTGASLDGIARGLAWVQAYNDGTTTCQAASHPRIDIVTVSMGTPGPGDAQDNASQLVDALAASGVIVVAAAGNCGPGAAVAEWPTLEGSSSAAAPSAAVPDAATNETDGLATPVPESQLPAPQCERTGDNTVASPAIAAGAIAVVALDDNGTADRADDRLATYSSRGPMGDANKPDLAAPGHRIRSAQASATPGEAAAGWVEMSGTSMAAPHVAGAAALLLQADSALTVTDVRAALTSTALDRAATGWDASWGHGQLDAFAAVAHVLGHVNAPPVAAFSTTCELLTCAFTGNASTDADGHLDTFTWDFGDGSAATGRYAQHTFTTSGSFPVTLTVTDEEGATHATTTPVAVSATALEDDATTLADDSTATDAASGDGGTSDADGTSHDDRPLLRPPVASAEASPATGPLGTTFRLDGASSSDADGSVASFAWFVDSDDEPEGTDTWFAFTPDTVGLHVVRLRVTDNDDLTHTTTVNVDVTAATQAAPTKDDVPPLVTVLTPADGATLLGPVLVSWQASDASGIQSTRILVDGEAVAQSTLNQIELDLAPGAHAVELVVTDGTGNEGRAIVTLIVLSDDEPEEEAQGQPEPELTPKRGGDTEATKTSRFSVPAASPLAALAVIGVAWVFGRRKR